MCMVQSAKLEWQCFCFEAACNCCALVSVVASECFDHNASVNRCFAHMRVSVGVLITPRFSRDIQNVVGVRSNPGARNSNFKFPVHAH